MQVEIVGPDNKVRCRRPEGDPLISEAFCHPGYFCRGEGTELPSGLASLATALPNCDLSDDAVIYAGAAVWSDWRNHVPAIILACWGQMSPEARAATFLCCHSVTGYERMVKPPAK
jgi:hypothetical protein